MPIKQFFLKENKGSHLEVIMCNNRPAYSRDRIGKHMKAFIEENTTKKTNDLTDDTLFKNRLRSTEFNEEDRKTGSYNLLGSNKFFLSDGFYNNNPNKRYISVKGIKTILYYMICVDYKKDIHNHEKPNYSLDNINQFFNCLELADIKTDIFGECRLFIEYVSQVNPLGPYTLIQDELNHTWHIVEQAKKEVVQRKVTRNVANFKAIQQHYTTYKELYHTADYIKDYTAFDKLYFNIKLWIDKYLNPFKLKTYSPLVQIGDKYAVEQKVGYYIPSNYRIAGKENEANFQTANAIQSNLLKYIWNTSIIRTEAKYRFVFSNAGQGKTALLAKLFLKYREEQLKHIDKSFIGYFNIDDELEEKIITFLGAHDEIEKYRGTQISKILLLDGLDEDPAAITNIQQRLSDLRDYTKECDSVIITCRTNFFENKAASESTIRSIFGDLQTCEIIYLSNFSPRQIDQYLIKRYKLNSKKRAIAQDFIKEYCIKKDFISQPLLLNYIDVFVRKEYEEEKKHYYKSELYEQIIRESQAIEAQKTTINKPDIKKHVDLSFESGIAIAKLVYKKSIGPSNSSSNRVSSSELSQTLKLKEDQLVTVKRRSIIIRDTLGNWLFAHNSFKEFFIGYAAYKDFEFDRQFAYPTGFHPNKKKSKLTATYFYTELMLIAIRKLAVQGHLDSFFFKRHHENFKAFTFKDIDHIDKELDFRYITHSDIASTKSIRKYRKYRGKIDLPTYTAGQQDSSHMITVIRAFKSLESKVDLSLKYCSYPLSILGNLMDLKHMRLEDSKDPVNLEELTFYRNLRLLHILKSTFSNIASLSALNHLQNLVLTGESLDETIHLSSPSIQSLSLDLNNLKQIDFLENCPNINYLFLWESYKIENYQPLLYLKKLKHLSIPVNNKSQLLDIITVAENAPLSLLNLKLGYIDEEALSLLQPLSLSSTLELSLRFLGIVLNSGRVKRLFEHGVLDISELDHTYSYESIETLRRKTDIDGIVKDVVVHFNNQESFMRNWRKTWFFQMTDNTSFGLTELSVIGLSKYQFKTIALIGYYIQSFVLFDTFKNLEEIYLTYIPSHQELSAVFYESQKLKNFCIYRPLGDIDVSPLHHLHFKKLIFGHCKADILNLHALKTCRIESLEFEQSNHVNLQGLCGIYDHNIPGLHIHNTSDISFFPEFLFTLKQGNLHKLPDGDYLINQNVLGISICLSNCGFQDQHVSLFQYCGRKSIHEPELNRLNGLNSIYLQKNHLQDTTPFSIIRRNINPMGEVDISRNPVVNLDGFVDYTLSTLSANHCAIQSIPKFTENSSIYTLSLEYNPLEDITHIGSIGNLLHIKFKGCNQIKDLKPLKSAHHIQTIEIGIRGHQVSDFVEAMKDKPNLEDIGIIELEQYTPEQYKALKSIYKKGIISFKNPKFM